MPNWYITDKGPFKYYVILLGGGGGHQKITKDHRGAGGTVGSDVTLRENGSVFIRCRTMSIGAALASR